MAVKKAVSGEIKVKYIVVDCSEEGESRASVFKFHTEKELKKFFITQSRSTLFSLSDYFTYEINKEINIELKHVDTEVILS